MTTDVRNRGFSMTKNEFLKLMNFPAEWELWEMYPDELYETQISRYRSGHEDGSEHDRNGAFHWWIRKNPNSDQLRKLLKLTYLDPDIHMAEDVRERLRRVENYIKELEVDLNSNR